MEGSVTLSFQHLELLSHQVSVTIGDVLLSAHHHDPLLEAAIHRMNDARCEDLLILGSAQRLLLCFTSQTTVVTFVQAP